MDGLSVRSLSFVKVLKTRMMRLVPRHMLRCCFLFACNWQYLRQDRAINLFRHRIADLKAKLVLGVPNGAELGKGVGEGIEWGRIEIGYFK